MKKLLAILLALAMVLSLAACGGGSTASDQNNAPAEQEPTGDAQPATEAEAAAPAADGEKETVELTLWGAENDQELLRQLADEFIASYASMVDLKVEVGVESESTAKDTVLTDIDAAADVFAFADDQLAELVNAGALQSLNEMDEALVNLAGKSIADVQAENGTGAIAAATYGDTLYAFPKEGGNGFFLYYDSDLISEDQVKTWDSLLDAAQASGKKVGMTLASGWYNAGFFLGAGFYAHLNADGTTDIDWNGTAPSGITGVQVTQAMLKIASHPAFQAVPDGGLSGEIATGNLCAVISGTWDADPVQQAFGGYAATVLPTFEAGGQTVQQYDYAGFKLVGVNAHSKNVGWATLLAEYITNEDAQRLRYTAHGSLPTNLAAASMPEIQDNVALKAIAAQDAYGVVQTVGGKYWDPTATFGEMIAQGQLNVDDEAGIQAALDSLVEGVTAPVD